MLHSKQMLAMLLAVLLAAMTASAAKAGKYNPVLDIGGAAPAFGKLPGVDGKEQAFADFQDREVLVVVFTCNTCPYALDYEKRIIQFVKDYCGPEGKVGLVAINVNRVPGDLPKDMKERAEKYHYNFPYLYDESQQSAKQYGATFTPEFFVLDKERKVVYMGAMDDNTDAAKVKEKHVENAVNAALAGQKPSTTETVGIGCLVRYARERRK